MHHDDAGPDELNSESRYIFSRIGQRSIKETTQFANSLRKLATEPN